MDFIIQLAILVVGFVLLIKGADVFVEGASKIADRFHIPQIVIGLTIVAFGTSAPEAAISITSALKGSAGIAIGNVVGSNIMNILLIIGITSLILPLAIQKNTFRFELPFVILVTVVLLFLGNIGGAITFIDGLILWALFIVFFVYLLQITKSGQAEVEEVAHAEAGETILKMILMTVLGLIAIVYGSNLTIDACTAIAKMFGLSDSFIGLTVVAFGTSLPELITCITAARKGKDDIAIGNIVGSNIFNILFVVGTTGLITTIPFATSFLTDTIIAIAAATLLFVCTIKNKRVSRLSGAIMLACYAGYFGYLVSNL